MAITLAKASSRFTPSSREASTHVWPFARQVTTVVSWITVWCNPPNEALGPAPTSTEVIRPDVVDGYFWIERPGDSNGTCNGGAKTGAWWKERALLLARRARWN